MRAHNALLVSFVRRVDSCPLPLDKTNSAGLTTEALNRVGIGALADNFPSQMSGGEQQRVAIARAVAKRPDVLLCDEPTGALDFRTGQLVLEVLEQVNREFGTLIVIVTHNAVIADMADRVVRMSSGTIVEQRRNAQRARVGDLSW